MVSAPPSSNMARNMARLRAAVARGGSAALLAGLFIAGTAAGYVYHHDPAPDVVSVRVDRPPETGAASGPRVIAGTVSALDGGRLTLATPAGPVSVTLPASVALDELRRAPGGLPAGARVNVGVEQTQYGLTLTGIVAVEGAR
ncbi:MAG: hypothetical protein EXR64_03485 [Dehalococcoidia bacterium]|nr:hypothetical protein [Dehalococcoidia bacterium]